jgi:signal peptidase I
MRAKDSEIQKDGMKSDSKIDSAGVREANVTQASSEINTDENNFGMDTITKKKVPANALADTSIDNDTEGLQDVSDRTIDFISEPLVDEEFEGEFVTDVSNLQVRRVGVDADSPEKKTAPQGFLFSLMDTVRFICLGLLIGILLVVFVVQRNDVYGSSMEPTLHNSDAVFVEMISKYFKSYDRGDIVTIDAVGMDGYDGKEKIIKRVIGLPGETVTISDGLVYIDGVQLDEPYLIPGVMTYVTIDGANNGYDQITLGENQYYCMGDNRGASNDSRRIGPIDEKLIKSHVIARIFPMDDMKIF